MSFSNLGSARLAAILHRRDFFIAQARLEAVSGGYRATILAHGKVASVPAERKSLENDATAWRVSAGGALLVLDLSDCSVALTRYRDAGAPSWGDHSTCGSGLAGSIRDVARPDEVAVREGVEEFMLADEYGKMIPTFGDPVYDALTFGAVGSAAGMLAGVDDIDERLLSTDYQSIPAEFMPVSDERSLTIGYEDGEEECTTSGLIVLDPATRGIDLMKVIRMDLRDRELDELAIFDGEADRQHRALNAPVSCLRVNGNRLVPECVATFQGGRRIETMAWNGKATPVLRAMFDALN